MARTIASGRVAPRDEGEERDDEQDAQHRDAAPVREKVARVHHDLSEPLVRGHGRAADGPRKEIRADDAVRKGLSAGSEVPPHVGIRQRLGGRDKAGDRAEEKRDPATAHLTSTTAIGS